MRSRMRINGRVTVRVIREDGRQEKQVHHNIVTNEGDALIADLLCGTPTQTKVDETNGYIEVGSGWTGLSPKSNSGCNTPEGSRQVMDSGYPQAKGSFGNTDDNVVVYRSSWTVGTLEADGVDEAALMNAASSGVCLAYAQITPELNITANDTLQIEWELSFLGS